MNAPAQRFKQILNALDTKENTICVASFATYLEAIGVRSFLDCM